MIDWQAFDWQSFATLTAGILAVGGAVVVGLRQTAILRKQAEIAELTLRHALFDRRYVIYASTRDLLVAVVQLADRADPEIERAFLRGKGEAELLFADSVCENLDRLWKLYTDYAALRAQMKRIYDREGHYGEGNPKRDSEMLLGLSESLSRLPLIFGEELRLGSSERSAAH